jgi:hypothetical protein
MLLISHFVRDIDPFYKFATPKPPEMLANTLLSVVLGGATVSAMISAIALPKTIQAGAKFDLKGQSLSSQGYYEKYMMLGVQSASSGSLPWVETIGDIFLPLYSLSEYQALCMGEDAPRSNMSKQTNLAVVSIGPFRI